MKIDPGEFAKDAELDTASIHHPSITVIIPTCNRKEILRMTLEAYKGQTAAPSDFDIVVVDDGSMDGTRKEITPWVHDFPFKVTVLAQPPGGPAKARNRAISNTFTDLVLITGDDIIPQENLIQAHLDAHQVYRDPKVAILGHVDWHPDLEITDFMTYITKIDGQQFAYHHITDPQNVHFGYFYTSNISLKTSFLKQGKLFSEAFRYAACEDIELGYRLKQLGMHLVYRPDAIGYHLHPMDLESFCERQFKVGQMMALLLHLHPGILDIPKFPPPETTLEKITATRCSLDELENRIVANHRLSKKDADRIRQLRFQMYREIIYGYQALGLCEERRMRGLQQGVSG
jgi:GT2 family glycosyltransferase